MNKLNEILDSVDRIIKNSDNDIKKEIYNISNILEIDEKTATVLHFVNKDSGWNPYTLKMLEDVTTKLSLTEKTLDLAPEKIKQTQDFYLINYLNTRWEKIAVDYIKKYSEMGFFNVWLRKLTSQIIRDISLVGLYPEDKSGFIIDRNFTGDGLVHPLVAEWITNLIRKVMPDYREYDT